MHDADAHGTTEPLQLPRDALLAEVQADPALALRLLCSRSRRLHDLIGSSQLRPLDVRIVQLILTLAGIELRGQHPPGRPIEAHMTQNDMSDMLGISRQSLNIEWKKLECKNPIRLAHARLLVVDTPAPERYVGDAA